MVYKEIEVPVAPPVQQMEQQKEEIVTSMTTIIDRETAARDGRTRATRRCSRAWRRCAAQFGAIRRNSAHSAQFGVIRRHSAQFGAILRRPISAPQLAIENSTLKSSSASLEAKIYEMLREAEAERVRLEDEIARLRNQIVQDNRDLDELRMLNQQLRQGMIQYQQLVEKMTASVDGQSFGGGNGYGNGYANGTSYAATHSSYVAPPAAPAPKPAPAPAPVAAPHKRSIEATIPPLKLNLGGGAAGGGSDRSRRRATARPGSVGSSLPADLDSLDAFVPDRRGPRDRARARAARWRTRGDDTDAAYLSPRLSLTRRRCARAAAAAGSPPPPRTHPDPPPPPTSAGARRGAARRRHHRAVGNGRVAAADSLSAAPRPLSDFSQSERLEEGRRRCRTRAW